MTNLLDSSPIADTTTLRRRAPSRWWGRVQDVRTHSAADPLIAGFFGFLVSVAFSWVPSVWYDESATIASTQRSWSQLWSEIHTVDAVHAVYYAVMHGWFALVGYSPVTLRLPSALAVGVAAALVALLARELTDKRTGIVAGILFALLPRVTWAGGEGRSYATATALAAGLSLVFLHASRRTKKDTGSYVRWWVLYGLIALVSTAVFLYSALLVVAQGITLILWAIRSRTHSRTTPWRPALGGWLSAAVVSGLLLVPLARLASDESKQIGWILKPGLYDFGKFFGTQWFTNNPVLAGFGWALVIVGIVVVVRKGARFNSPNVLQVALPWILVPTLGLIAASMINNPLYSPRYVTFGAPAVAILMAVGLTAFRKRLVIALGLVAAMALTGPTYVAQRLPESKDNSSWAEVAKLVAHEREIEGPNSTDAIVYGHLRRHPSGSTRSIAYAYPAAFEGMTDVTLKTPAAESGDLWETRFPLASTIDRVDGHQYVWLVTSNKQDLRPSVTKALAGEGFHVADQWNLTAVNVLRYER